MSTALRRSLAGLLAWRCRLPARRGARQTLRLARLMAWASLTVGLLVPPASARDLELNEASQAELESLPGVGPALSGRLLQARRDGAFTSWADAMKRVKGLGPAAARRLAEAGLTVAGDALPPAVPAPPRSRAKAGERSASAAASTP